MLDTVVAVPLEQHPGTVVSSGAADATAMGSEEQADKDVAAAREARCIHAFEPQVEDVNPDTSGVAEIATLMQQLQDISDAAERSVATEVEAALEGGACLLDDAGRQRLVDMCKDVRKRCEKLSRPERQQKLQAHLADVAARAGQTSSSDDTSAVSDSVPLLEVPRGDKPLSLSDWQIWSMAMPTLFTFGDAANLYPERERERLRC